MTFADLGLSDSIQENLKRLGYSAPTPIQVQGIEIMLSGKDLLGIAQTGTGKTAAFALPIIQRLAGQGTRRPAEPKVLVIVPTRELCQQVELSFTQYAHGLDVRSCSLFGGVGQREQVTALKAGVDIVVATPGRLLDLCQQKELRLSKVEILVMDEADRMLDLGFAEELEAILALLPEERQNALFTATMPEAIAYWAKKILNRPEKIDLRLVTERDRNAILARSRGSPDPVNIILGLKRKIKVDHVTDVFDVNSTGRHHAGSHCLLGKENS